MRIAALLALALLAGCTAANTATMSNPHVVLETSKGAIELEIFEDTAPTTAGNFLTYVEEGHYDGLVFHRVIEGFMIQGGGFTPDGRQAQVRAPIALETTGGPNAQYTVAMARTNNPDSATSQFFINTVDNPALDPSARSPGYAVFGKVVSGQDVVEAIEGVDTGRRGMHDDWPVEQVVIERAHVKA